MKKIIILTAVIFLVFTGLSLAAQKTITTYIRAGNMTTYLPTVDQGDFVTNDPSGAMSGDLAHNNLSLGNEKYDATGSYIYGGDSDIAFCVQGKCVFGIGVRVYFEFTFKDPDSSSDSKTNADGFSFFIINGSPLNNKNSTGGAPTGISIGEMLGYGGPGRTAGVTLGLQPPKMGIEFDTYPNTGNGDVCVSNSRVDADNNNHIALLFWGDNTPGTTCTVSSSTFPKATFDDNRHGAVGSGGLSGNSPANSAKLDGTGGYYAGAKNGSYNWLEDGLPHRFRMEITRSSTGVYNTQAWVDCTDTQLTHFQDLTNAYSDSTAQINRTVTLTQADHDAFRTMLFGWGFGTGGSTETVLIKNFHIYFPRSGCAYGTNPTSASPSSAAQSGNINVLATAGCAWTASSDSTAWLTTSSTGTGNGLATYNVTQNTGSDRTGHITIGDPTTSAVFTVTQANGCTYAINPTSRAHTYSAAAGQTVAVTAGTGCTWTAVSNNAWITVTGGASGTGNGTVTYSITTNTGSARTGTITIGSQTFFVNQAIGLPTCTLTAGADMVAYNGTNSLTWSVTNSPTTATWTTSPGGTCGSPNPAGGSCTTAAQTAGTKTYTLTVTNASGSSTCSDTFYVGCQNYSPYNNTGARTYFKTGATCSRITSGSIITNALASGVTVTRYGTSDSTCSTALGSINYTAAMNADIQFNGGDHDCTVYYNIDDTVTDR